LAEHRENKDDNSKSAALYSGNPPSGGGPSTKTGGNYFETISDGNSSLFKFCDSYFNYYYNPNFMLSMFFTFFSCAIQSGMFLF
jgi:hypothetical protein